MATEFDHTIEEPLSATLRLRADLRIERRQLGGRSCYVIEDPIRGKFYRLGVPEFTFAALLNGTRTVRTAIREAAELLGELAFKENEALTICHWLLDAQLVENPAATEQRRLTKKVNERPSRLMGFAHPLSIRIPILNPSKVLTVVEPWLVWTLRTPCFLAWLAFLLYAAGVAAANWHDLVGGTVVLLDREHCWLLFAAWLGLKLLHETYHAIVCRKYGGTASQAGIFLLFFAPVPYVDVTSSWRFASKWRRIATAAAGMYVELFVAALAVVVWANNTNGTVRHVAISIAAMASLGTIVINANPLMRFDGYFIFADLLDIPNLNTYGRRWLRSMAQQLLGCPDVPPCAAASIANHRKNLQHCRTSVAGARLGSDFDCFNGAGVTVTSFCRCCNGAVHWRSGARARNQIDRGSAQARTEVVSTSIRIRRGNCDCRARFGLLLVTGTSDDLRSCHRRILPTLCCSIGDAGLCERGLR